MCQSILKFVSLLHILHLARMYGVRASQTHSHRYAISIVPLTPLTETVNEKQNYWELNQYYDKWFGVMESWEVCTDFALRVRARTRNAGSGVASAASAGDLLGTLLAAARTNALPCLPVAPTTSIVRESMVVVVG